MKNNRIGLLPFTEEDFEKYLRKHSYVVIENEKFEIGKKHIIKTSSPPNFELETTNVWSFPKRGDWATHKLNTKYRGNWSPYIPRNLILRYSKEGDWILDCFVGSGTTLIEAQLLGRNAIGVDINPQSIILTYDRLNFEIQDLFVKKKTEIKLFIGDARNLNLIDDESVDMICTHPPYVNIIKYSTNGMIEGDLSNIHSVDKFLDEMEKVATELIRVLKPEKYCAIMIGDTRREKKHVPLAFKTMERFLKVGFKLKEDIIKIQHNMKTTPLWRKKSQEKNFLLLWYEHIFVFEK